MAKIVKFDSEARSAMIRGVDILANTDIRGANNLNYDSMIITNGIHKNEIKNEGIEKVLKNYKVTANFMQSELKW